MRTFFDLLATAIAALLLHTRRIDARGVGFGHVFASVMLLLAATAALGAALTTAPRQFWIGDLAPFALGVLLVLTMAALVARMWGRPILAAALACLLLLEAAIATSLLAALAASVTNETAWWPLGERPWPELIRAVAALWTVLAVSCALRALDRGATASKRVLTASMITAIWVLPWTHLQPAWFFYPAEEIDPRLHAEVDDDAGAYAEALGNPPLDLAVAEATLSMQDVRLDAALAKLAPQRPGVVDLYVLAAGLDGNEDVFLNEAAYVQRLFDGRYGTAGRSLMLANNPASIDFVPLATRTNLGRALTGIAARMDPNEDVLFVWIASHGGKDHELLVRLEPLALAQIDPPSLSAMLEATGLAYRVIGISACYSGGYIPALAGTRNLVLTAASAAQPSFGCGPDADITWFGRALLVEAFNRDPDPVAAFAAAAASVAAREAEHDYDASKPQLARAGAVESAWARWRAAISPGPEVPFTAWTGDTTASSAR